MRESLKRLNILALFFVLVFETNKLREAFGVVLQITPSVFFLTLFVQLCELGLGFMLIKAFPPLGQGLFRREPRETKSINSDVFQGKYGLWYVLLFACTVPYLALWEEKIFRGGTQTWEDAFWRSVLFGLVHAILGIPWGAVIAIATAGLWYTHLYFQGGIELSALYHTTHNLLVFLVLFCILFTQKIKERFPRRSGA